jgi:hypothetical protein
VTAALHARSAVDHVAMAGDPAILGAIVEPTVTLAVWTRPVPVDAAAAADRIVAVDFAGLRVTLPLDGLAETLPAELARSGVVEPALVADMLHLARLFGDVMRTPAVDIRLDRITNDACRKFHADYVTARLITTYHGPATQWLDQPSAAALAAGAGIDALTVRTLETGDVACLKGRTGAGEAALVHRSPPIAGTGRARLVLVLNPA